MHWHKDIQRKGVCHALEDKEFSIVILAGGQSRRMGRDKATLSWEQGDLLSSLLTRLLPLSEDVMVSSNVVRDIAPSVRQVADIIAGKGPLSGIHAGLVHARYELVFVTACDVPFLRPELVPQLVQTIGSADGSAAVYKGQIEPLFACYRKKCAPVIEQLLTAGNYRVTDFLERIHWIPVQQWDELDDCCFMNVNTRTDYENAKVMMAKGRQP